MWFNKKYKERISDLEMKNISLRAENNSLKGEIINYKSRNTPENIDRKMAALMRESLGLQVDFSAVDNDKCLPPHFLDGLSKEERDNFIIDMETIYSNERFQKVVHYMINLFATNAIYKYDKEQRDHGQIAVIAFRTLLKKFDDMHKEFLSFKKVEENFDSLAVMPE